MDLENLYAEVENFKAGGGLCIPKLEKLYKERELYKSRKAARIISGIVYFLILAIILLSLFYNPVRSFMISFLKLNSADFSFSRISSGSFWLVRVWVFLAALIANCFLFYWKEPFAAKAIGNAVVRSIFSAGIIISPYLVLIGLLAAFFSSFGMKKDRDDKIKEAESHKKRYLFRTAIDEKDMKLMQLLADIKYEDAVKYVEADRQAKLEQEEKERLVREIQEKMKKDSLDGEKIYEEAVASDPVNEELMEKAARLGSISACYYLGKNLLAERATDMYTSKEKEEMSKKAAKYFDVARQIAALTNSEMKTECEFLWLNSRLLYESNTEDNWEKMLTDFRNIQKAGDLPDEYNDTLEFAIKEIVKVINEVGEESGAKPTYNTESPKKPYCVFCNGAICTKLSTSSWVSHCDYVKFPEKCATALIEGGLEYR